MAVTCELPVESEAPRLLTHAPWLALPALGVALFASRERLRRARLAAALTRKPALIPQECDRQRQAVRDELDEPSN
jgi:hypothetical protein